MKILKRLFKKKESEIPSSIPSSIRGTQPYLVRVKNTTKEIKEFNLFGAIDEKELKAPEGITIDCPIETTCYNDLLWTSILNPIKVSYMQMVMIREDISWEEKGAEFHRITLKKRDAKGNSFTWNITPIYNSNEITKSLRDIREEFIIDGFTSIWTKILPETTMMYYFYTPEKL